MVHICARVNKLQLSSTTKLGVASVLGLALLAGCGSGSGNGGSGRYTVADAGPTDGAGIGYQAVAGPNDAGQLVGPTLGLFCGDGGQVNGCFNESPYVYTPGHALQTIQQMGNLQGINNHGDIIGFGTDGLSFIIQNGRTTSLGSLGGASSQAYALNDADQVVGSSLPTSAAGPIHAFLWQAGRMTDLGGLPGYSGAEAFGINNLGQIVGDSDGAGGIQAVYWHDGKIDNLGALVGESEAVAINNSGEIVGWATRSDGRHAIAWQNGAAFDLGPGQPVGIDDAGNAVGAAPHLSDASGAHAMMWAGGRAIDLNTLIDPASGWVLQSASGVNKKGQIAGSGLHNGVPRAFLLTPR